MPRYVQCQLRWFEQAQTYMLAGGGQSGEQEFTSDWLGQVDSFSFQSRSGMHYTVRKQRVQRGGDYWYAYRRMQGRIVKRYLGKAADLTLERLEEIARHLEIESGFSEQPERGAALPQPVVHTAILEDVPSQATVGALPLLFPKLSLPRLHTLLLERPRLFALLDAGQEGHFTLLSAPAGSGKTTLVGQWIAARRASSAFPQVAWVSLETSENDLVRFWRYLITACQVFQVDLVQVHSALLEMTSQPPFWFTSLETVLTTLLNMLAQSPVKGILVLEDYHVITSPQIHEALAFFLDHLPDTLHLIIITRHDPPFSLARLRARSDLYEIRAADLRFLLEETGLFFQQTLSFPLAAEPIQRFHAQLEGWAAGLHLAKLALQRSAAPAETEQTLALFFADNPSFQEYFVSEVFAFQPEAVQQFLLQTSILPRLTASLCDAVTEQQNSQELLILLERSQLFLEPLDPVILYLPPAARQWYRYHALFAEAMRGEARQRLGEDHLRQFALRASRWYQAHGLHEEAIDAVFYAQDYECAAALIEQSIGEHPFPLEIHELHTLHRWLTQLPADMLKQHPILCVSYATTLLFQSASWLPDASTLRALEPLLLGAEQRFREANNLPKLGELAAFRSLLALRQGDTEDAIAHAKQALEWLPREQQVWRGLGLCVVAAEWVDTGHLQQARAALLEAYALCEATKNRYFKRAAMLKLAQVCFEQGEMRQATAWYHQVRASAREEGHANTLCQALAGLAALCYERNELDGASQYAQEAVVVSQSQHFLLHEVHAALILARVQQAQGLFFVAQQQLAALLERIPVSQPGLSQEIQTAQARLALAAGDHMTVQRWATSRQFSLDFSRAGEEEVLFCRWLLTQDRLEEASGQLESLLTAARQAGHVRWVLEIQVEMVLVTAARKHKAEAQHLLREVLEQAFEESYTRLFLDAGEQMALLLRSLLTQLREQYLQAYVRALLNAFPVQRQTGDQSPASFLVEPLSPQEMRVLRLLAQHRSNADIARELVVSVNTVRTQVQSIYSKLGVHTRGAASEVARELHLL